MRWLEPLKTKRGEEVAEARKKILNKRNLPKGVKLWVDKGKEFYNKRVKDLIEIYRSEERRVGKEGRSRWSPNH